MQTYKVSNDEEEENNYNRRKKTNYVKLMNNMLWLEKTVKGFFAVGVGQFAVKET